MKLFAILTIVVSLAIASIPAVRSSPPSSAPPLSSLLAEHAATIATLRKAAAKYPNAPSDAVFYLRYCLGVGAGDEVDDVVAALRTNLAWRAGEGKEICALAKRAVRKATSAAARGARSWDNAPVAAMAPHASVVGKFITDSQCLTTATRRGDLLYIVRAGKIDDAGLMAEMTVEDMAEYFLYCREVNSIVANARSLKTDRLVSLISLNDLTGAKFLGSDARFRKALSATSAKTTALYPGLAGPTLILNLPSVLGALVQLFAPMFPEEVRKKIMFAQGPMRDVRRLRDLAAPGAPREKFLDEIDALVYPQ